MPKASDFFSYKIGEKSSEQLEVIPAQVKVIENVTLAYKCPTCSEDKECITTSTLPLSPIPKSFATPSLLAYIVAAKFLDALPLYRQEAIFLRHGLELSRSTMARWMIKCADLAVPLLNLMREDLLEREVIGCDETPIQVLDEPDRAPEQKSYMWVCCSFDSAPIRLFRYYPHRSAKTAVDLLSSYQGVVVCDGLKSYDAFARANQATLAGCMAHIRRKFFQADKAIKKASPKETPKTCYPLKIIRELYKIEKAISGQEPDLIDEARKKNSRPLMDELKKWLDIEVTKVLPKSLLGKAINYSLDQWSKMQIYLNHPKVPIDNNGTERSIRPFVIGRKNWIFSKSPAGAEASASLYSLCETAKANGIDPFDYLCLIFKELPKAMTLEQYQSLLPYHVKNHHAVKTYQPPR